MVFVGNRDARRRLELGFGSREEDMKGSELEEGEAGFIDLNGDDDNNSSTVDPDVALSYIDEKLQHVLGHFQKDFEGGVSAENLGAKFGGYGSFLPSYQRSPPWPNPRTPTEFNHCRSRSPDNGQHQNGQTNSLYSSPDIISSNSATGLRRASRNDQRSDRVPSLSKSELPNSTKSDPKSWKVRIKVGKDDLISQKYADIYSGLGLDVSPSPSLNESPVESEGQHHSLLDIPDESLSRILQIMTSSTLSGKLLLSPLSDEVICLTEKEWITIGRSEPKIIDTEKHVSDLNVTDKKTFHGNKLKSIDQSSVSVIPTYSNNKYISHASSDVSKKETVFDTLSCQELIASTMKLPLLSDIDGTHFKKNSVKSRIESKVSAKSQVKSDTVSDVMEKKAPEPVASFENIRANKSTKKSSISRKAKRSNDNLSYAKTEVNCTDEKDELAMKNVYTLPQTVIKKNIDFGEDSLELHPGEVPLSFAHENRANENQNIVAQEVMYPGPEDKILNNSLNSEDLLKDLAADRYKESFKGLEQENDNIESKEMTSIQTDEGSGVLETRTLGKSINISKEKSMGKKSEDLSPLDRRVLASNVSHHAEKEGPNPDVEPIAKVPLLNEDRVLCDKCHKWRILPLGINLSSLPEKWVCSMLDWLPGMNHCGISQDDTTLAVRAAHASISMSKHSHHPLSSTNFSVASSGDARRSTDDPQNSGLIEAIELKENHAAKDVAKGTNLENTPFVRNSKRLHESTKTRSLNDIDTNSPSINDFGYQHIPLQNHSNKDDILKTKIENNKDNEVDGKRASKKIKMGDTHLKDENYTSDSRLSDIASGKSRNDNNRFRTSKSGIKNLSDSSERPDVLNTANSDDGSHHLAVHYHNDNLNEKKVNDALEPGAENRSSRSRSMLTERHETDVRIPKKARVSKSEGKDRKRKGDYSGSSANKVSRGTKNNLGHDLISGTVSQRSTDAVEPLRKDLGLMQPSVAATSSSSKVSNSLRSKTSLNEMKDSPIESVSSSPLRASGVGQQFSHTRRNFTTNHDFQDTGPRTSFHDEPICDIDQTGKLKSDVKTAQDLSNFNVIAPDQGMENARQIETLDQNKIEKNEREGNASRHSGHSKKAGKGSSRSKDKKQVSRTVCDNGKANHIDPVGVPLYEEKSKEGSNKSQGAFSVSCDRTDKSRVSKKDSAVDCGDRKEQIPIKVGVHDGTTGARGDAISIQCQDVNQTVLHNSETGRPSRSLPDVSERGKSNTKQLSLRGQIESTANLQPIVELNKENGNCANENVEQSKALKQPKTPEKPNANQQTSTRNSNSSIHKGRAVGEPRDSSSQAVTNAVKEAKDLKHMADRLKNSGSTESTGLYFQAALKFLHGACLLESCNSENGKQTKIQSMEMYSSTAKLCEFCAHEYEKSRDMAAAALAYKCVEVAYMRVIYTSHSSVNKVRNDVQTALQLIPTGDSPSSSASDIDNLNNAANADKAIASSKGVGSPQVAGTQVLMARNRSSCLHLIRFAQEVTFAMEASRKSRSRLGEAQNKEGISSVKKALDFNFQDVNGLLHLIRVAMEAINR